MLGLGGGASGVFGKGALSQDVSDTFADAVIDSAIHRANEMSLRQRLGL